MKFESVELRRVKLPLTEPFRTSFGTETDRDILLIRVKGPDSDGWGECTAMSEPLYSPEYVSAAHAVIRDHLLARLTPVEELSAEDVPRLLSPVKGHRMAKAALEMAVLDAQLVAEGRSLAAYLGGVTTSVPAGVSVGVAGGIGELVERVGRYLDEGYVRVKLKIQPGWDIDPVRAVRARFGTGLLLQVDANGSYQLSDASHLRRLDEFELLLIEQPLPEDDLAGHVALAAKIKTPICLDESITSVRAAADAIDRGACAVINVKAGRLGGYLEARAVHDLCVSKGIPVWCGGMLETGVGRAANLALSSLPGFTLPGDISASDRYWKRDLTEPFVLDAGEMRVPGGPGIGVRPDPAFLEEVTTRVEVIPWLAR